MVNDQDPIHPHHLHIARPASCHTAYTLAWSGVLPLSSPDMSKIPGLARMKHPGHKSILSRDQKATLMDHPQNQV